MFKLSIECTKDISELHINFTDGTSAIVEQPDKPSSKNIPKALKKNTSERPLNPLKPLSEFDDVSDVPTVQQSKVKLPDIEARSRPVKVAEELQNLDL